MNVYDFDNTIYDGESVVDFFIFTLNKKKSLIIYLPLVTYIALLYKIGKLPIKKIEKLSNKMSYILVENKHYAKEYIEEFWEKNNNKLKKEYLEKIKEEDIIITAAPRILLDYIKDKFNTNNIICTEFNLETGSLEYICMRENKAKALLSKYPNIVIDEFYTDSMNDKPLMEIAKKTYLVKRNNTKEININKLNIKKKLIK